MCVFGCKLNMCIFKKEINLQPNRIFERWFAECVRMLVSFFLSHSLSLSLSPYACVFVSVCTFANQCMLYLSSALSSPNGCCLRKCRECENVYHVYNMRLLHRIFLIVTNIILFDVLGALVFDLLQNFIVILVCWCPFSTSAMINAWFSWCACVYTV